MKNTMKVALTFAAAAVGTAAFAGWTLDPDTNILIYDVATGVTETNTTTLTSTIAGVEKTGGGTIVFTTASTAFTGKPVTVSGGTLEMRHTDALGSGNTVTVAGDATLSMIFTASSNKGGEKNDIVLQQDATLIVGGDGTGDYFIGNVTLEGDATIDVQSRRGFGKTLDLAGYTLTRIGNSVEFMFAGNGTAGTTAVVKGPGTILNSVAGTITLMGAPSFQGEGTIESAHGSTTINMWNLAVPMPWKFKATESAYFRLGRGLVGGQSANPAANIWAGDVEIAAGKVLQLTRGSYPDDYLTISGDISGAGSVSVGTTAEYRLSGRNNTYSGGTAINANTLKVFADGNVSTNGAIKINGGVVELHLDGGNLSSAYVEGMAKQMAQSAFSDGHGTLRFVTAYGTDVTLTSDMSAMHPSIAIHHEGDGSLTLSGNIPSGAQPVNQAGSFYLDGNWSRNVWAFICRSGRMDVKGGSLTRPFHDGKRTYRIGSSNNVASARMRVQSGAMLDFPRGSSSDVSEPVQVMDEGTKPAILEIHDGATVTAKVQVAVNQGTKGAVYQYGGDVYHTSRPGNDGSIGYFGKAYWWMNGGTFASDHATPYLGLGSRTGSESQFEVQGGDVTIGGDNSLLICRGGASRSEFYMGGGTANINQLRMGGELQWGADHGADPGGMAVLTLSGTNNPTLTSSAVRLNERTNEFTSVVNLNAGLLTASTLSDVTKSSATRKDCKSYLNFNGGALKTANTAFIDSGAALTKVTVYGKGGSIDITATGQVNWYVPFQCPEGRGVKSITVPSDVALDGYAMPPVVKISGGGGDGATAHVKFDPRTGRIEREIEVTCPGWGFVTAPTAIITAPDMETAIACDVTLTEGDQESGGLTVKKGGSGSSAYLMVYAANTYTGDTVIAGGTFYMQHAEAIPLHSNIRLAGGHLATRSFNPSRARLGGYGSFASWDSNRFTITGEIYYDAADLAQGRKIRCSGGHFYIGSDCALTINGLDSLPGGTYLLMDTSGTGKIHGTARFANDNPRWKLAFSESKITLKYVRGTTFTIR
jgi:autotransporter-associated beta strand protein